MNKYIKVATNFAQLIDIDDEYSSYHWRSLQYRQ